MDGKTTADPFQTTHQEITVARVDHTLCQGCCRSGLDRLESDSDTSSSNSYQNSKLRATGV